MGVSVTPPAATLPVGDRWLLDVVVTDDDGALVDVAPVVTVTDPAGVAVVVPVDLLDVAAGAWYRAAYVPATAGRHVAAATATGYGADHAAAYAVGATTAGGMPNADDVATYIGADAASWDTADLADALLVEAAAQRAVCRVGATYPDDMRGALLRRTHRNLAMRRLPLAMPTGDADSDPGVLPGRDPEVRRLEKPYRKVVIG